MIQSICQKVSIWILLFASFLLIPFISGSQNVIQLADHSPFGKIYLDEWLEVPKSVDNGENPSGEYRHLRIIAHGPKAFEVGIRTQFVVDIIPEYSTLPLTSNDAEAIRNINLSIRTTEGFIKFYPAPKYEAIFGSEAQLKELSDISDCMRNVYDFTSFSLELALKLTKYLGIGLIYSISEAAASIDEALKSTEYDWRNLWRSANIYDSYPIPNPRDVKGGGGVIRIYRIHLPCEIMSSYGSLDLILHNVDISSVRNFDQITVFSDRSFNLLKSEYSPAFSIPLTSEYQYSTDLKYSDNISFRIDANLKNESNIPFLEVDIFSESPDNISIDFNRFNIFIEGPKRTCEVRSMPVISDHQDGDLHYILNKTLLGEKAVTKLVKVEIGSVFELYNSTLSNVYTIAESFMDMNFLNDQLDNISFNRSNEILWMDQNSINRFAFPTIGAGNIYEYCKGLKIKIPLVIYDESFKDNLSIVINSPGVKITDNALSENAITTYSVSYAYYDLHTRIKLDFDNKPASDVLIGLIIDSSGSMEDSDPKDIRKSGASQIMDLLEGNESVFIVDFDGSATWLNHDQWQNWDRNSLKQAINRIDSDGSTNVGLGLTVMRDAIQDKISSSTKTAILLLSDGKSPYNKEAEWFINNGTIKIPVHTISYKDQCDAALLSEIALSTGGSFIQANDENDIVRAFYLFYNKLNNGSKILSINDVISQGESKYYSFFIDNPSNSVYSNLSWMGSDIGIVLTNPAGIKYNLNAPGGEWLTGINYKIFKMENPLPGKWTATITGLSIPTGGESYIFEVNTQTLNYFDLKYTIKPNNQIYFQLIDDLSLIDLKSLKPKITLDTPKNQSIDLSGNYKNGEFYVNTYNYPGSYSLSFSFQASTVAGEMLQRFFKESILIGSSGRSFVSNVSFIQGNYIIAGLGKQSGNRQGNICYIYAQDYKDKRLKAKGYVTTIDEMNCTIEVGQTFGTESIQVGDIVELDFIQWQNDKR